MEALDMGVWKLNSGKVYSSSLLAVSLRTLLVLRQILPILRPRWLSMYLAAGR